MVQISPGTLAKMRAQAEKMMGRIRAIRERSEHIVERGIRTAVVTSSAFAIGMVEGKTGGVELAGLPLPLLVGAGAHVAGFLKVGGRHSDHLHNVGDGAVALYAGSMGRAIGKQWKETGKLGFKSAGALPSSGSDSMSDADLANAVLRR